MPTTLASLLDGLNMLSFDAIMSAATYGWRKALAEARWNPEGRARHGLQRLTALTDAVRGSRPRWPRTWTTLGTILCVHPTERGARLESDKGTIEIAFFASDLVRVNYAPIDEAAATQVPYAILKPLEAWPVPDFVAVQKPDTYLLQTADMVVGVHLSTARLFLATPDGTLLRTDIDAGWGTGDHDAIRHRVALAEGERLLGLGERATRHDRRGRTHILWNSDPAGYSDGDDPINLNIPVMVSAIPQDDGTTASHLVFYENPYYAEFDLGDRAPDIAKHRFAGGELRTYLAVGPLPTLLERYTELTGQHSLQPLWMLGYQQSRWSYDTEARVRKLAQDFRDRRVPCDVIHLDIDYMDGFRCFTWDREDFPDPAAMAAELRDEGFKLISIIDPGIKQDPDYDVYRQGIKDSHFCTTPDGQPFHAPVWPGDSAFPDFTSAETRAWWGKLCKPLLEAGIAGFWNDMNEPSAFAARGDRTLPANLQHAMEGRGGTHAEAHNLYGMLMARATREGLEALQPEARPVAITRAGWAGVQRYATSWTADNESTWEALRLTIPMMLGLGLSGIGFTGPDIGGFVGEPDGELFTRWVQMAAFMPFFRAHTAKGYPDQEPWSYGEPYLSIIRRFIELRYELLPYLYTAIWQMSTRGWPMVRPWRGLDLVYRICGMSTTPSSAATSC
jgi:alpha-glucosidase